MIAVFVAGVAGGFALGVVAGILLVFWGGQNR